jgi:hypothetical protein
MIPFRRGRPVPCSAQNRSLWPFAGDLPYRKYRLNPHYQNRKILEMGGKLRGLPGLPPVRQPGA